MVSGCLISTPNLSERTNSYKTIYCPPRFLSHSLPFLVPFSSSSYLLSGRKSKNPPSDRSIWSRTTPVENNHCQHFLSLWCFLLFWNWTLYISLHSSNILDSFKSIFIKFIQFLYLSVQTLSYCWKQKPLLLSFRRILYLDSCCTFLLVSQSY